MNIVLGSFCDSAYVTRLMVLIESIRRFNCDVKLHVIALDSQTNKILQSIKDDNLKISKLSEVFEKLPVLKTAFENRTLINFYFTLTSAIPSFLLDVYKECEFVFGIDSDLYFFDDPELITDKIEASDSIYLSSHNFSEKNYVLNKYGKFNSGFVGFRNNMEGKIAAGFWLESCIDYCDETILHDSYADQKYLERLEKLPYKCHISESVAENLAPWNLDRVKNFDVSEGKIFVNGKRLIYYHFSGISSFKYLKISGFWRYKIRLSRRVKKVLYKDYFKRVSSWDCYVKNITGCLAPFKSNIRKSYRLNLKNILIAVFYLDITLMGRCRT
jgi:hypothetical protein